MTLPQDPAMLLSFINMKLRDEYPTLDELCKAQGINRQKLETELSQAGFKYNEQNNKFW